MNLDCILFLITKQSSITIRRYCAIAEFFHFSHGSRICFFGIDDCDEEYVRRCYNDAIKYYGVPEFPYEYVVASSLQSDEGEKDEGVSTSLVNITDSDDELVNLFLNNHLKTAITLVGKCYGKFFNYVEHCQVKTVFYDIPIIWATHAMLDACRNIGACVISLEHAEGIGEIYSNLPSFADYYISYGEMNNKNLRKMGVPEERVLLTGNIDTDFMHYVDTHGKTSDFDKQKNILLILKPVRVPDAEAHNKQLIDVANRNLSDFIVHVRVHPTVVDIDKEMQSCMEVVEKYPACHFVDAKEPLSISLERVDSVIAFPSYSLVEAVMLGKKTICISGIQDFAYIDWGRFGILCIHNSCLEKELSSDVVADANPSLEQVKELIKYFRYRNDTNNLHRVTEVIEKILTAI